MFTTRNRGRRKPRRHHQEPRTLGTARAGAFAFDVLYGHGRTHHHETPTGIISATHHQGLGLIIVTGQNGETVEHPVTDTPLAAFTWLKTHITTLMEDA